MYTQFYGFKERPFEITPDPGFLFLGESHREALAHLIYAARDRKGFTVITGEVGTGKTTLVQAFLHRLNGKVKTAYIFNPRLNAVDFLRYICEDFGIKEEKHSKGQYIALLHNFLLDHYGRNEQVILIIDEAQSLPPALLEEVRLLTNLETPKSKLLQVILIGQPELNRVLNSHSFRQLKQRISLRYHLQSLNAEDTKKYIETRLAKAGAADPHLFTAKALDKIYTYSEGIPRLINTICDNALLAGYSESKKIIGPKIIGEAVKNLEGFSKKPKKKKNKVLLYLLLWGLVLSLVIGLFLLIPGILGVHLSF
ncbi:MAG: AAA family ATPase [Thermodesulfobacteriota bacterium]